MRLGHDQVGLLLTCVRMRLGGPDESGRPRLIPETTEDAHFDMRCDRVILALGQALDLSILPEGSQVHEGQALLGLTGAPVFYSWVPLAACCQCGRGVGGARQETGAKHKLL